jgi:hypothetical protein
MEFVENRTDDSSGVMAIRYVCPNCGKGIAMVTNPGETQMVRSLGVSIGHEALAQPGPGGMSLMREALVGAPDLESGAGAADPIWSEAAELRLAAAPVFVQAMVRRLYTDWARRQGYPEVTPAVMNEARQALGMSDM